MHCCPPMSAIGFGWSVGIRKPSPAWIGRSSALTGARAVTWPPKSHRDSFCCVIGMGDNSAQGAAHGSLVSCRDRIFRLGTFCRCRETLAALHQSEDSIRKRLRVLLRRIVADGVEYAPFILPCEVLVMTQRFLRRIYVIRAAMKSAVRPFRSCVSTST